MNRRRFLQSAIAVPGAFGFGNQVKNAPRTIRVSVTPYPTMSSLYVAYEQGYFKDAGLNLEIEPVNSTFQVTPLLASGKIDVSFGGPSPSLINAIARGARMRIVAAREIASSTCGDTGRLYGRRDRFPKGLNDAHLLKGKQVAVRRASINEFVLDTLVRHAGLRAQDVEAVYLDRAPSIAALIGGKVDALVSGAQLDNALTVLDSQLVRGIGLAQVYPNFQYSYAVFGKNLLDGPTEIGISFLKAYFRGSSDFLHGKTPRFLEEYARSNNLDYKQLRAACRTSVAPDGRIDVESLPRFVTWAIEKGYCEASVRNTELTDSRFLASIPTTGNG